MKRAITYLVLALMAIITTESISAQQHMRIQGVVTTQDGGHRVPHVAIMHDGKLRGESNEDGNYSILATPGDLLLFRQIGYVDTAITVGTEQIINVTLKGRMMSIDKVVVAVKATKSQIAIEPTDIEVVGNYLTVKTTWCMPDDKVTTDSRFVMQPVLHDLTNERCINMRPVVIDGDNYKVVAHRYMNFGDTPDSLASYVIARQSPEDNIYAYQDSLYVGRRSIDNDYKVTCHLVVGSYDPPHSYSDTLTIARGRVNTLRFFDNGLSAMSIDESTLAPPKPDLELHSTNDIMNIEFEVGQSRVEYRKGDNRTNIEKINRVIERIERDPNATLKSIKMRGYASPEGGEKTNKTLADRRTKTIMDIVTSQIESSHLKSVDIDAEGVVEPWSRLVEMAEEDGNQELADKLTSIISRNKGSYPSTQYMILKLPEYQRIIKPYYLPRMRRVEYEIDYTIFRPLTIEEVRAKYAEGREQLTRSEYYLMISQESDSLARVNYEREAISDYPTFIIYLNREAVRVIDSGEVDLELFEQVIDRDDLPQAVIYNQVVMLLRDMQYELSGEMVERLDSGLPAMERIINVARLYTSRSGETYDYFRREGGLNEVLVLLRERRDVEAYERMKLIYREGDARMNYVMAICTRRTDDYGLSIYYLERAISLDSSLRDIAMVDGDLTDVYSIISNKR